MFSAATQDPDFSAYARSGCAAAFRRLVDRHLPAVHSAAVRTLGRHAAHAGDVTQGVFILLARKAPALPAAIVVPAWLHRQTVRLSLNAVRSESRRWRRETAAAEAQIMNNDDDHALWRDLQPHVDRAMLRLPDADRAALALRFLEKKSLREVGETLGLSTDAAQKRVERALEKLRGHLVRLTPRAVTVTVLAGCMAARSVEAAPARLAAHVSSGALAAVPPASFLFTLTTIMSQTKALSLGAVAGLLSAGAWTLWNPAAATLASPLASSEFRTGLSATLAPAGITPRPSRYFPKAALTPEEILAQVQQILTEPDTEVSRLRLRGLLGQLSSEQCGEVLKLAAGALPKLHLQRFHREMVTSWPRMDGPAAMNGYAGLTGEFTRKVPLVAVVFASWLKSDAPAARQWLVENQDVPAFKPYVALCVLELARTLAGQSEEVLLSWARQMAGSEYLGAVLNPLVARLPDSGDEGGELRRLAGRLAAGENGSIRNEAMEVVINYWSNRMPGGLGNWIASQQPGELSSQAAALALAALQDDTGYTQVQKWIQQQQPAEAARIWQKVILKAQQICPRLLEDSRPWLIGPGRDAVILHAARAAWSGARSFGFADHPAEMAILWAAELTDPAVRDPLIYGLYRQGLLHGPGSKYIQDLADRIDIPEEMRSVLRRAKAELLDPP